MSELMSLTVVTQEELQAALANRKAAKAKLKQAVADAVPKYKDSLNLRWWNFIDNKKTSEELLLEHTRRQWYCSRADILNRSGALSDEDYTNVDDNYYTVKTVLTLAASRKETFQVGEVVIAFLNKWSDKVD